MSRELSESSKRHWSLSRPSRRRRPRSSEPPPSHSDSDSGSSAKTDGVDETPVAPKSAGEALLFGHEEQQPVEGHLLDRLRGGSVELATDVKPLGVGVDSELDRGVEFTRIGFCFGIHRCQVGGLIPA